MDIEEKVRRTVESGTSPLTFFLEPTQFFSGAKTVMRTRLVINSLEVGTLTHAQYRFVASRSKQGDALVERHLEKLLSAIPRLTAEWVGFNCFSFPVYARMLRGGGLARLLFSTLAKFPGISPSLLCAEISADVVYEDMDEMRLRIKELHDLGIKVAVSEIGDEYCPLFRLSGLKIDYAFLDPFAVRSLSTDDKDRVAGSVINYLHFLGAKVVAPGLTDELAVEAASALGCDGVTNDGFAFDEYAEEVG